MFYCFTVFQNDHVLEATSLTDYAILPGANIEIYITGKGETCSYGKLFYSLTFMAYFFSHCCALAHLQMSSWSLIERIGHHCFQSGLEACWCVSWVGREYHWVSVKSC